MLFELIKFVVIGLLAMIVSLICFESKGSQVTRRPKYNTHPTMISIVERYFKERNNTYCVSISACVGIAVALILTTISFVL